MYTDTQMHDIWKRLVSAEDTFNSSCRFSAQRKSRGAPSKPRRRLIIVHQFRLQVLRRAYPQRAWGRAAVGQMLRVAICSHDQHPNCYAAGVGIPVELSIMIVKVLSIAKAVLLLRAKVFFRNDIRSDTPVNMQES